MKAIKDAAAKPVKHGDMPLLSHLTELRRCFITSISALTIGFAVAFYLYDPIIEFLFIPLRVLSGSSGENLLYVNTFVEGFFVRVKISAMVGFILSLPFHVFNLLYFVFPGLKAKEKRIMIITLISSFLFIAASFIYSYYSIIPISITFLTGKGFIPKDTGMLFNFGESISYIVQFMLVSLVVFQLPIILEMLMVLNVVKRKVLLKLGKYVIIFIFILSAVITPPDCITQIGLALPMTGFFYLTILIAKIFKFGED